MKNNFLLSIVVLLITLTGCVDLISEPIVYTSYTPILISRNSLKESISLKPKTSIIKPAKIYYKDNFIFISERYKGVHVINNSNPSNPVNEGYIAVPGCVDMAIKNNVLYVDNAVDLVAISLSSAQQGTINVLKRIENVFPEIPPPDGGVIPSKFSLENRPPNTILIGWKINNNTSNSLN